MLVEATLCQFSSYGTIIPLTIQQSIQKGLLPPTACFLCCATISLVRASDMSTEGPSSKSTTAKLSSAIL